MSLPCHHATRPFPRLHSHPYSAPHLRSFPSPSPRFSYSISMLRPRGLGPRRGGTVTTTSCSIQHHSFRSITTPNDPNPLLPSPIISYQLLAVPISFAIISYGLLLRSYRNLTGTFGLRAETRRNQPAAQQRDRAFLLVGDCAILSSSDTFT